MVIKKGHTKGRFSIKLTKICKKEGIKCFPHSWDRCYLVECKALTSLREKDRKYTKVC